MTNEEALKYLIDPLSFSYDGIPLNGSKYNEAMDVAIVALEKQIPKKPVIEDEVFYCPTCYKYEGHDDWKREIVFDQDYCDVCGQRINWSDYD